MNLKHRATVALFLAPSLLTMFLVMIVPVLGAFYLSTQDFVGQRLQYVGLVNYAKALKDGATWHALWVNMEFTVLSVSISLVTGFLLAILLSEQQRWRRFFRVLFTLPWPVLSVVVGINFAWMFNAQFGIMNRILLDLGLIDGFRSWLGDARTAMPIVLLATAWKESPFFMIMILAGLQAIPQDQYEAAAVDGASRLQQFWFVTLPNLRGIVLIAALLQLIWRFREFDMVEVMTQGGPNRATEVLAVLVYRYTFQFFRFGQGAAIAILMSAISLGFTLLYLRHMRRQEV